MENNKILIDIDRYEKLLVAENELLLAKRILFNSNNRLNYDNTEIYFDINSDVAKTVFPLSYKAQFTELQKAANENV